MNEQVLESLSLLWNDATGDLNELNKVLKSESIDLTEMHEANVNFLHSMEQFSTFFHGEILLAIRASVRSQILKSISEGKDSE